MDTLHDVAQFSQTQIMQSPLSGSLDGTWSSTSSRPTEASR
ncbi:MAG: hypothetical protein ACYC4S_16575 [Rhodoferax sp.]